MMLADFLHGPWLFLAAALWAAKAFVVFAGLRLWRLRHATAPLKEPIE